MIRNLERDKALALFQRVYGNSVKRTLVLNDGTPSGWSETDFYPEVGGCEILIDDIQVPDNFRAFVTMLLTEYQQSKENIFFLEEEYLNGRAGVAVECDYRSLHDLVRFVELGLNLDTLLVDERTSWVLKMHHEGFGYFSGTKILCERICNDDSLRPLSSVPKWER